MPVERILQAMAERAGEGAVVAQRDGYVYVGAPRSADLEIAVFAVPSGEAGDWLEMYKLAASERARAESRGDIVVVRDTPENLQRVRSFHEAVSGIRRQYMVEVVLAELTEAQSRSVGIDFELDGLTAIEVTTNFMASGTDLTGTLETFLEGAIFGDSEETRGEAWDAAVLHVMEGETARIQSGDEVNVRRRVASPEGTVSDVGFDTFETGLQLEVVARGVAAGLVRLDVRPQLSAVREFVDGAPTISTRELDSQVLIGDGGVAVLGGLRSFERQRGGPRVPGTKLRTGDNRRESSTRFFVFIRLEQSGKDAAMGMRSFYNRQRARGAFMGGYDAARSGSVDLGDGGRTEMSEVRQAGYDAAMAGSDPDEAFAEYLAGDEADEDQADEDPGEHDAADLDEADDDEADDDEADEDEWDDEADLDDADEEE